MNVFYRFYPTYLRQLLLDLEYMQPYIVTASRTKYLYPPCSSLCLALTQQQSGLIKQYTKKYI